MYLFQQFSLSGKAFSNVSQLVIQIIFIMQNSRTYRVFNLPFITTLFFQKISVNLYLRFCKVLINLSLQNFRKNIFTLHFNFDKSRLPKHCIFKQTCAANNCPNDTLSKPQTAWQHWQPSVQYANILDKISQSKITCRIFMAQFC